MDSIRQRQWLLAALSGILQVLIFPSPSLYFLGWIALVPLLIAIARPGFTAPDVISPSGKILAWTTPLRGFFLGYLSGLIWYAGSCYWVFHVMHRYGKLSTPAALGVLALFCLYLAIYHGLFGFLLALAALRPLHGLRRALLLAPFLWVAVELARARITGFPWDLLGTSQVDNIPLTRVAVLTGVYGISFIIVLVNCGMAATLLAPTAHRRRLLPLALAVAAMLQLGIFLHPAALPAPHSALLVQPNVPLDEEWTPTSLQATFTELAQISALPASSAGDGPRLIVWPESPAPFFESDPGFRQRISGLARQQAAHILVTLVGELPVHLPGGEPAQTNRVALIAANGAWLGHYDKIHLVPFGEYVPFKRIFAFAGGLTEAVGNYVPGNTRSRFEIEGHKFAAFICYESIFPDEVRQFAAAGAQVFINVSDDGWYGRYGAPGQHLNMARMRAIENRRWVLRATNSGITASIDPLGRVVAQSPPFARNTLAAPYDFASVTTFYTLHGDWFAWACVIISLAGLFVRFRFQAGSISS